MYDLIDQAGIIIATLPDLPLAETIVKVWEEESETGETFTIRSSYDRETRDFVQG